MSGKRADFSKVIPDYNSDIPEPEINFQQSGVPKSDIPIVDSEFDYRTATTGMQGESLPAGATQFDPLGRPYFGPGLKGTLKRYAWQMLGSPESGWGAENWERILEITSDKQGGQTAELAKRIGGALFGAEVKTVDREAKNTEIQTQIEERIKDMSEQMGIKPPKIGTPAYQRLLAQDFDLQNLNRQLNENTTANISEQANKISTVEINGEKISLLQPAVRAVQVGVDALLGLFSAPSILQEQGLGAQKAMREYVNPEDAQQDLEATKDVNADISANDEKIKEIQTDETLTPDQKQAQIAEINREQLGNLVEWTKRSSLTEAASRLFLPLLQVYDTVRFFAAPGTIKEKTEVIKKGWNEGRLLYSEFVSPAIEQEYRARAAQGEEPQLLAMELQNPWAEMAGQLILDPLNFAGIFSKSAKIAGVVDDMKDTATASGLASNAQFLNKVGDLSKVATDAEGIRKVQDLSQTVKNFFYDNDIARVFKPQEYTARALNAAGNRALSFRKAGNVMTFAVSNLFKNGYKIDDVNDWLSALVKLSSKNLDEVQSGIQTLTHFPAPMLNFNQDALETSALLRNLLKGSDDVVDVTKLLNKIDAAKGDWKLLEHTLRGMLDEAVKFKYPSVSEMKKAAEVVRDNKLVGKTLPNRTLQLAEEYKNLEKTRPGLVRMAALDEFASKPKDFVNKILGNFYFSYNYGFATRNGITNTLHVLVDAGTEAFFEDGKYLTKTLLDEKIEKWGLSNHPALAGFHTMPSAMGADTKKLFGVIPSGTSLAEQAEIVASKRVFYKYFRQTMDNALRPGVALPPMEEFLKRGLDEGQVKRFVALIKENYGDVKTAKKLFMQEYGGGGPDAWRMWQDFIDDDMQIALRDNGVLDDVMEFTKSDATQEDIAKFFQQQREKAMSRAKQAMNDLPGVSKDNPILEQRAAISQRAGKNFTDDDNIKLDVLLESSYAAHDKYIEALGEIAKRHPEDKELYNLFIDLSKRTPDNKIGRVTKGINDKAWELDARARKGEDLQKLWSELGAPGKFSGTTSRDFISAMWEYVKGDKIPNTWTQHFDRVFSISEQYAKKYGVSELLQEARLKVGELQQYRNAQYSGGKIYRESQETLYSIAEQYGVTNKYEAANIVKKRLGQRSWTVDEIKEVFAKRASEKAVNIDEAARARDVADIQESDFFKDLKARAAELNKKRAEAEGLSVEEYLAQKKAQEQTLSANVQNSTNTVKGAPVEKQVLDVQVDEAARARDVADIKESDYFKDLKNKARAIREKEAQELGLSFEDYMKQRKEAENAIKAQGVLQEQIPPPYVDGANPASRMGAETYKQTVEALDYLERKMLENYGMKAGGNFNQKISKAFDELTSDTVNRMAEAQLISQKTAEYWRDFALLPYGETTHMDHALSYIMPYQFWYSRSYANWAKRLASDPQIIAAYAKMKDNMAKLHKDSPEWWKYNVKLPEFMWGLNNGNPMYINLEASVWPLYGLTGTDFNDPYKRTNWFTSTVDDLGKFGPSIWSPINMAIAAGLSLQGEQEAAAHWGSRIIPQTATLKAIMSQMGMTPIELDPAIQAFDNSKGFNPYALDVYEEGRVLRALAEMQNDGLISDEQMIEISYKQEGDIWNEAITRATQLRAPGQIASFFLGVGFKARTEQDMMMDNFYSDYYRMKELHKSGYISDEQYKQGFNELRKEYPFMDAVLLGRRAGDDRDAAYVYNVMSRIPPGMMNDIIQTIGVDRKTSDKFFESGGNMEGWNEQERENFINAWINAGAIIAIPENSTRVEWTQAKNEYNNISSVLKDEFGDDITTLIDDYFSIQDKKEAELFMSENPVIGDALDLQNKMIIENPLLLKYYGGIDTLERYYTGAMYDKLELEYGEELLAAARQYSATINKEEKAQILKDHPELKNYWDDRERMNDAILRKIIEFQNHIPEREPVETYGEPANPTQASLQESLQPKPQLTAEQWTGLLGPALMSRLMDFANGDDLTYQEENLLDYYAERLEYEYRDDLLKEVLMSIQ